MEIDITAVDFINLIGEALRIEPNEIDGAYQYHLQFESTDQIFNISEENINEIIQNLSQKSVHEDTAIYDDTSYEVLVKRESPFPGPFLRGFDNDEFILEDEENKLTYKISQPTNDYILFLLYNLKNIAPIKYSIFPGPVRYRTPRVEKGDILNGDVLELLKRASRRFLTLKIHTHIKRNISEIVKYSNSLFFQLSYNLDVSLVPEKYFDELTRMGRIRRIRRSAINDLVAPKRHYIADLIYQYQLAVASDNPSLEYLSYYHILEHFFESVFNDDLIERVRQNLTQPDFSYKRKKDIQKLINIVSKSIKLRGEKYIFNEGEALKLTLINYITPSQLLEKINEYDESLVEYYKNNKVGFSDGDPVDLEETDVQTLISKLTSRIYKTRNAIVHSKESERSKYVPFSDDKYLAKEIPLLRFISECIIIESSSIP